ncbi:unnamed protein product [Moneuplotes crassus]|uniref:Uncharacterized protein n=1 Tax=Euplotes crassus TaxID=5936 RepID=A0AAD1YB63_EUPCR|nr:unnamed protein product [Moneuplotes crassus]
MNKLNDFNENLSEDLLDENASVSSINISTNLDKNMSKDLFSMNVLSSKILKAESCPLDKLGVLVSSRDPVSHCSKDFVIPRKELLFKKFKSQGWVSESNLQSDIKHLLRRAMRIRSNSDLLKEDKYKGVNTKVAKPSKSRLVRGVTIHDCEAPKCSL